MAGLRQVTLHPVSNRPNLFMGGDRELVMFSAVIAGACIFSMQTLLSGVFGVALWVFSLYVFRLMARTDPLLRQVYLEHIKFKHYYPAHSSLAYENSKFQENRYRFPGGGK
jgi:Type IV secretory pathway, TrbD component